MTPEQITKAQKLLDRDKYSIIVDADYVFIMHIMFGLGIRWETELGGQELWAGATDGKDIILNPVKWNTLAQNWRVFLLCHETYHVVFKHMFRCERAGLNHSRYNEAADHFINLMMLEAGMFVPVGEVLCDRQYSGMSLKQIYDLLPEQCNSGQNDLFPPQVAVGGGDNEGELVDKIDSAIITAAIAYERKNGHIPGAKGEGNHLSRAISSLLNPTINWLPIAKRHMTAYKGKRLSMSKPNRRYLPTIMPSRCSKGMGDIAVFADSSGSVTEDELKEQTALVRYMHKQIKPDNLHLFSFDHDLHHAGSFKARDKLGHMKLQGGGGTDIDNVMAWCKENKPKLVVVFSDGDFYPPTEPVAYDLVWIIIDNAEFTCEVGRVIHQNTRRD